jgi:hypothetical protein
LRREEIINMTIAIRKWLGLAVFGLVACGGKDVNLGEGVGQNSAAISYTQGCTPASCAPLVPGVTYAGSEGPQQSTCPVPDTLQCVPDPFAGQGSDPAGHCNLEAVCPVDDAGSPAITYVGGCTPASCANQAAACVEPAGSPPMTVILQCGPDPNAGKSADDPVGNCTLEALCGGGDGG